MKLKEYWPSFWAATRMKSLDREALCSLSNDPLPIVVTLTSIPSRLKTLHLTIRSVLNQSRKPEKVVLWLNQSLHDQLPLSLRILQSELFEIRYVELTCSHRKLIHSLQEFPLKVLVTCDDDLIYERTWLERLYADHLNHPQDIIAHECRRIMYDEKTEELLPYKQWPVVTEGGISSSEIMAIGYGGVLYPPGSLLPQVIDSKLFMKLAPRADDLWFKAMSFLQGTVVRHSSFSTPKPIPLIGSQKISLLKTNVREDGNRVQWNALCEYFKIVLK